MIHDGMINQYWCRRHWEPYEDPGDKANPNYANVLVPQIAWGVVEFREHVRKLMIARGMSQHNAATATVDAWVKAQGEPMCCILGDIVMDRVLRESRAAPDRVNGRVIAPKPAPPIIVPGDLLL